MLACVLGIYNVDTIIGNGMRDRYSQSPIRARVHHFPKGITVAIRLVCPKRNLPDFENILFKVIPNRELYEYRSNLELL